MNTPIKYRCPSDYCNAELTYMSDAAISPSRHVISCPHCGDLHVILDGSIRSDFYVRLFSLSFVELLDKGV